MYEEFTKADYCNFVFITYYVSAIVSSYITGNHFILMILV